MFEILKIFVEQLVKALNLEVLLARRDKSKLAEVGASLFSLYSSLNGIYVHGREIASCIRDILRDYENSKQVGGGTGDGDWVK
jgi:hypothetical protein